MAKTDETEAQFVDSKGRALPAYMNDREIAEAILTNQRAMMDLVGEMMDGMKHNPMLKMMMGGKR